MTTTNKPMNRAEFIAAIQKNLGKNTTKVDAERALNAVMGAISVAIKTHKGLQLVNFMSAKVTERKARMGVNPRTKEKIRIKASKAITFKVSDKFKSACGLM